MSFLTPSQHIQKRQHPATADTKVLDPDNASQFLVQAILVSFAFVSTPAYKLNVRLQQTLLRSHIGPSAQGSLETLEFTQEPAEFICLAG